MDDKLQSHSLNMQEWISMRLKEMRCGIEKKGEPKKF